MNEFELTNMMLDYLYGNKTFPVHCHREDCPDRRDGLCPYDEEYPRCPKGRDERGESR